MVQTINLNLKMHTIVQTPRLIVREFLPEEEPVYLTHFNDPEVCKHIPKRSRDERINILRTAQAKYADTRQAGIWGMFDRLNGAFIGSCLLRTYNDEPGKLEIGYSMERHYWGKGIATEMAKALVDYAFINENTKEVVGITTLDNTASQHVLEKAGLVRLPDFEKDGEIVAFFKVAKL